MNIVLINSAVSECGVYQYGKRVAKILETDSRFNFFYSEISNTEELTASISSVNPDIIIYNWHVAIMPWLTSNITNEISKHAKQLFIFHEAGYPPFISNGYLMIDMTENINNKQYPLLRPIFEKDFPKIENPVPVIGSFGFGFENKGFDKICDLVQESFSEAIIKLHITNPFFGDYSGNTTNQIMDICKSKIKNPRIKLEITNDFKTDDQILDFLNSNSLNVFLYDDLHGRGLSSVIDYAVSVNTPLAVNNSYMFRHITSETPEISVTNNLTLEQIMNSGIKNVLFYRNKWSHELFKNNFFNIICKI
jgi:hypothetical protein